MNIKYLRTRNLFVDESSSREKIKYVTNSNAKWSFLASKGPRSYQQQQKNTIKDGERETEKKRHTKVTYAAHAIF